MKIDRLAPRAAPVCRRLTVIALLALTSCGTVSVYDENDLWAPGGGDRHYTHGVRVSMMFPAEHPGPDAAGAGDAAAAPRFGPEWLLERAAERLPFYDRGRTTQVGLIVGQDIYTPSNIRRRTPDGSDRPYAGWLYVGVLVANADRRADEDRTGDHVETFEVDAGIVGPHSYAQSVQTRVHDLTDSDRPRGWDSQIDDEFGLVATYDMRRRLASLGGDAGVGWDLIGNLGGSAGNVLTEGTAGLVTRIGWDLPRDFGVNTIHSTAVEVPDADRAGAFHGYVFGGVTGHAVAHSIFLDGNTFHDSASVDRNPLVGELRAGLALEIRSFRLAYTLVTRSEEFDGQSGSERFGSVSLTWTLEF